MKNPEMIYNKLNQLLGDFTRCGEIMICWVNEAKKRIQDIDPESTEEFMKEYYVMYQYMGTLGAVFSEICIKNVKHLKRDDEEYLDNRYADLIRQCIYESDKYLPYVKVARYMLYDYFHE